MIPGYADPATRRFHGPGILVKETLKKRGRRRFYLTGPISVRKRPTYFVENGHPQDRSNRKITEKGRRAG